MKTDLLELFQARQGVVCFVGAGGKKTTMYRLAAEHPGRVGLTTTAHIEYFPRHLPASKYIDEEAALLEHVRADTTSRVIAFAQPSNKPGRYAGILMDSVSRFRQAGGFELLLIKCDGARSRLIKAPNDSEPPVPPAATTVVPVVSAKVFGRRLSEKLAHRLEHLSAVTGVQPGEKVTPLHVARLLAAPRGALKNTGRAGVVPLINMVDDGRRAALAREAAEQALDLTDRFSYVVVAAMRLDDPIVEVITRESAAIKPSLTENG